PETPPKEGISINADTVEYSTDSKNVTAAGNVEILYKGTKLSCQKITVNTDTKEGFAEGGVRLDDEQGIIIAEKMTYNFQTKAGVMIDAQFRANPYFGKAERMHKLNDIQFVAMRTKMSTCDFDHPHYFIKSRKVDFYMGEKIIAKDNLIGGGQYSHIPILYLPEFNKSLKKPFMHVQVSPGKDKYWGYYLLSAWRYNLTDSISGNLLLDYRELFGISEGFTTNYTNPKFGKGDFKFYYTQERDKSKDLSSAVDVPKVFERYLVRWRHKWDIDENTNWISEYYRIVDSKRQLHGSTFNFLKDYFYREYEKDSTPPSYVQIHRLFNNLGNSSLDLVVSPRANRWYSQLEKIPEMNFNMPNTPIGNSRLYFQDVTQFANYNYKNAVPSPSTDDLSMWRFDTYNQFSYPMRALIFNISPFVGNRTTYYDCDNNGSAILPRIIFYSGAELSTKLYKVLNVKTGAFGLDIDGLRHIITPTIRYNFNNQPSILSSKLKQIDSVDAINTNNSITFELQNKLQTKRDNLTVDLLDFRIDSSYNFKSSANKAGGTLSDFKLYLDFWPYTFFSLHSDATFDRREHKFTLINADLNFNFTPDRRIGLGERYERRGSKETTFSIDWRINPKWKFGIYERYQFGNAPDLSKGLREQQYSLVRDMHCWTTELTYNIDKFKGHSLWVVFRLKAFPELQFEFDQQYHEPRPGAQTNYQ
ncbi:MAG: hypothetical protein FJZ15_06645, partial [Candidatus Omnitrophica bacterium]|nr:hypothetical protein [Candidatus Omnitrophota bacterium]